MRNYRESRLERSDDLPESEPPKPLLSHPQVSGTGKLSRI